MVGVVMGIIYAYVTVVLSTVERQFGIKSREAAWIYSGNEFSNIFFVVFLPFVGRVKRRPLFMGWAIGLSVVGLLMMALPYFTSPTVQSVIERAARSGAKEAQKFCDPARFSNF